MIYQEKTPAVEGRPAQQPDHYPLPRAAGAGDLNHRPVRAKAKPHPNGIALLAKVRDFKSAAQIRASGLYPYFRTISSAQDTEVLIEGNKVLMLGSNSYLGLTNHPRIKEAATAAVAKYGTGCAGSRFLNGTLDIHLELEAALAKLVNKEAVLLYSTGFQVNLGVISALVGKGEYVIGDKSNHASIVEGCLLAQGKFFRFPHKDLAALESRLDQLEPEAGKLVVVDGVFSMEGDIIQLPQLCKIVKKHGAALMLDDAHAIGVLGKQGAGTASHFNMTDHVHLIMGTFSKSLASLGGFIGSDAETIDFLKHHSRPLIFSASMSPANVAAVLAALEIMKNEPERIAQLWRNTQRMKAGLKNLGFELGDSETPILPVYCRDMTLAFQFCKHLQEHGVFVNPVVYPAVAPGHELIRISLMATHTNTQIDFALDKMGTIGKELNLI
jgi:8-amino-7-oxononanoate synthase